MKNQGNMTSPKEQSKCLITDHREMEIYELPNTEFKIIVLKLFRYLQEKGIKAYHYRKSSIHKRRTAKEEKTNKGSIKHTEN